MLTANVFLSAQEREKVTVARLIIHTQNLTSNSYSYSHTQLTLHPRKRRNTRKGADTNYTFTHVGHTRTHGTDAHTEDGSVKMNNLDNQRQAQHRATDTLH